MQNDTVSVATVIATYAKQIANAAYDSVVESNDYSITDNCAKIQFLLEESAQHTNVHDLAVAALNCTLDTVVRECMYNTLIEEL